MNAEPFQVSFHTYDGTLWLNVDVPSAAAPHEIGECLEQIARAVAVVENVDFEQMGELNWQTQIFRSKTAQLSFHRAFSDPLYVYRLTRAIEYFGGNMQSGTLH